MEKHTGKLIILNSSGHTEVEWETSVKIDKTTDAVDQFTDLIQQGYMAVAEKNGEKELVREFDPTADTITIFPQPVGG